MLVWDHIDYCIGSHYLPAIINGDVSGLSDAEEHALDRFQINALCLLPDDAQSWHWAITSEEPEDTTVFGRCEVSGALCDCTRMQLCYSV